MAWWVTLGAQRQHPLWPQVLLLPERYNDTYNPFWESVGLNKFLCIGTEQLGKETGIILFLAENVPFKIPCN